MSFRTLRVPLTAVFATAALLTACDSGSFVESEIAAGVASVAITPGSVGASVGDTVRLDVAAYDASGAAMSGVDIQWNSLNTGNATVTSNGTVIARAAGLALITATALCCGTADTAAVNIDNAVASISISPAMASIDVGQNVALSATAFNGAGDPMSGVSLAWSSSNTGVTTVNSQGVATGVSAGEASVVATANGTSDTATITVVDSSAGSGLVNECANADAAWLWCDDFDQDRLTSYFEYDDANSSFTRVPSTGVGGSGAMEARFAQGQVGAGSLKLAFGRTPDSYMSPVDGGTSDYRDVYWRVYVRHQAGWTGGGGDKLSRSMIFAGANWEQAMIGHVWSGGSASTHDYLIIDPASGTDAAGNLQTTGYNDFANLRWLGADQASTPIFDSAHVGQWYCVEAHTRLNDAGQSNGVFELWVDDQLEAQRTGLNWVGSYNAYGINAVFLENYWNNGSPQAQQRWLDNFVVSTQRIGCGDSSAPPSSQVASVQVTPASASISLGSTQQLTATGYDASGNVVPGVSFTWSSSNTGVATVDSLGNVFARAAGTAVIAATAVCCGAQGSADIAAVDSNGPAPDWSTDFSEYATTTALLADDWGHTTHPDGSRIVLDTSVGYGPSDRSMRYNWGGGESMSRWIDTGHHRKIWVEVTIRWDPNATLENGGSGDSALKALHLATWNNLQIPGRFGWGYQFGDSGRNCIETPGDASGDNCNNNHDFDDMLDGSWHTFRYKVDMDAGVHRLWFDGQVVNEATGWSTALDAYAVQLGSTMNKPPTSDPAFYQWWGNIKIWWDGNDPGW